MADDVHSRRIDVLAIGLFGLAVGALTLGVAQLGGIPDQDRVGTLVIALIFGGIVQILAGMTDIRYHEQHHAEMERGARADQLRRADSRPKESVHRQRRATELYAPINLVFLLFSSIMMYLTAYRNTTLCALHAVITITFFTTFLAHLDLLSEVLSGIFHILVGFMAFYHAVASLTFAFTGHSLLPLGPALLHHRVSRAHS